jgi:KDO2-lipid IV(A) lauroyltransferase
LAWSSNAGLASLGVVCATGIACTLLVSLTLLPAWWRTWVGAPASDRAPGALTTPARSQAAEEPATVAPATTRRPSAFYRVGLWRMGMAFARTLPARWLEWCCVGVARLYWWAHPRRRTVVIENLRPCCANDRTLATTAARSLFDQFGRKLADLWRWESGAVAGPSLDGREGWEHFEAVRASGRGILLVTPHLGNWELGSAILGQRGVKLLVLTLEEPDPRLTELRRASRLARGIETLVVGQDAFAFVEIIQRLQAGATVALLIDRPPPPSAVTVEFCGQPFRASVAAAELARASGCVVLGVCVLRTARGYTPIILPELHYDRAALGRRAARVQFTQEILRAFEPLIRQHPDQWYHFVPIWPERGPADGPASGAGS